jgi:hypothetical protein
MKTPNQPKKPDDFGSHTRALTLVYFHGRPAHAHLPWSIFTGDLPILKFLKLHAFSK